jgi:hypothetical protein
MKNKKEAGDKKNTAGGSWVAGFANRENILIFGGLKIHKDFFATSWRFWL